MTRRLLLGCFLAATAIGIPGKTGELKVSLASDRHAYHLNDTVALRACVKNITDHPVVLYGDLSYGIQLWPFDAHGKAVSLLFIPEYQPPPPGTRDPFLRLEPDHSLCLDLKQPLEHWSLDHVGKYAILAEYVNPFSPAWVREQFGITIWPGAPPASTRLEIEVLP